MKIQKMFLLLLAGVVFASCTNPKEGGSSDSIATEVVEEQAVVNDQPKQKVDLVLEDESGQSLSVNSLIGKVVFVNFWATWCPPCIKEMPSIDNLKKNFQNNEDLVFLMVDVDNRMKQAAAFMKDNGFDLPVYVATSEIPGAYLGDAIPTTVVINKAGEIVARIQGGRDYGSQEIIQGLQDLLAEK